MKESYVRPFNPAKVRGPLAVFRDGFVELLRDAGFRPKGLAEQSRLMAHFSLWLEGAGLAVGDLTAAVVDEYAASRRASGRQFVSWKALRHLLGFLRDSGAAPLLRWPAPGGDDPAVLREFGEFLRGDRAMPERRARAEEARARRFLAGRGPGAVASLTSADVARAMAAEGAGRRASSVRRFGSTLRLFLRFCAMTGATSRDLSSAVVSGRERRPSPLPVGATRGEVAALLASCDTATEAGLRDRAVIAVLASLGLRAAEAAGVRLDDIDWRRGRVLVRGKGGRVDELPWTDRAGREVAAYLREGRPPGLGFREVFATVAAPRRPLSGPAVGSLVARACARAGVARRGAHALRHGLAEAMVAGGAGLAGIGQVLRHASAQTTAGYARVDVAGLRRVAAEWPEGAVS
jgi:site-specific recombinase XerD